MGLLDYLGRTKKRRKIVSRSDITDCKSISKLSAQARNDQHELESAMYLGKGSLYKNWSLS